MRRYRFMPRSKILPQAGLSSARVREREGSRSAIFVGGALGPVPKTPAAQLPKDGETCVMPMIGRLLDDLGRDSWQPWPHRIGPTGRGVSVTTETPWVETFLPLADVKTPPMPTQEVLRRWVGHLHALIERNRTKPFIADDRLKTATLDRLNEVVAPPACGPLLAELGQTIDDWRAETMPSSHIKVVILPPCDDNDIVETWARQSGHQVLNAPTV